MQVRREILEDHSARVSVHVRDRVVRLRFSHRGTTTAISVSYRPMFSLAATSGLAATPPTFPGLTGQRFRILFPVSALDFQKENPQAISTHSVLMLTTGTGQLGASARRGPKNEKPTAMRLESGTKARLHLLHLAPAVSVGLDNDAKHREKNMVRLRNSVRRSACHEMAGHSYVEKIVAWTVVDRNSRNTRVFGARYWREG
jgi:hypothetical protein